MKRFLALLALCATLSPDVQAGEDPFTSPCTIGPITAPSTGSSASDADCSWLKGAWLTIQCDFAVRYTKNNNAPTASDALVGPGDSYPIKATLGPSSTHPVKILPTTASATTCVIYRADL